MSNNLQPIFPFLKYVNPTWYFNLHAEKGPTYFPDYDNLKEEQKSIIEWDEGYSSSSVGKLDAAYQAWNRGIILKDTASQKEVEHEVPSLGDNYRFMRKYFHPWWSVYILIIRLFSLHNPFAELRSFWSQRKVERVDLSARVEDHKEDINHFDSKLIREQPLVSVIIPTLNRYTYLKDALHDLELQDYPNFEVIVVDQSEPFQPEFYEPFKLNIQLIRQEEKALWLARNKAIQESKGEFTALFEDDVRANHDWLSNHLKCLDYFEADISAGVFYPAGSNIPKSRNFFRWADQFATGNACLKKEVFQQIGLFDRQFEKMRMGDGAFGLRAYLKGHRSISNPLALCEDVKAPAGGLRQMGSWDAFRPKSLFAPRPVPSVLYFSRSFFGKRAAIHASFTQLPFSVIPYRLKRKKHLILLYWPLITLLFPLLIFQFIKSWRIANRMLARGPLISELK